MLTNGSGNDAYPEQLLAFGSAYPYQQHQTPYRRQVSDMSDSSVLLPYMDDGKQSPTSVSPGTLTMKFMSSLYTN